MELVAEFKNKNKLRRREKEKERQKGEKEAEKLRRLEGRNWKKFRAGETNRKY